MPIHSTLFPLRFGLAALCVLSFGCATAMSQLSREGGAVKLMKSDPPPDCEEIGNLMVYGNAFTGDAMSDAKTKLRNAAARAGGNYVRLETAIANDAGHVTMNGTNFRCRAL